MIRRGITLTEVLVAIFVTGLGLMALMTLFPLGALNMSLAIKDDRASHCAANAASFVRTVWRQGLESGQPDPSFQALTNGTPVYLDPIGMGTYSGAFTNAVAGVPNIPRIGLHVPAAVLPNGTIQWVQMQPAMSFQYFSLMDDIEFDFNGKPIALYGSLPRETLYTWGVMLRVPQPGNPSQNGLPPRALEYSVVVYNRRAAVAAAAGLNQAPEHFFQAAFDPGFNTITVAGVPPAKKGSWVLDMSNTVLPIPHAYFYRVNSVTQSGPNGPTILKVDQALRGFEDVWNPGQPPVGGQIAVMDNVVEVFEKSTAE